MSHPVSELTAYLDGALEPAERAEVESHLARCGACQAERDRLAAALALLARLPPAPAPSPAFEQRFYARLAAVKAEARGRRGFQFSLAPRRGRGPGAEPPDLKTAKPAARSRQRANAPEALTPVGERGSGLDRIAWRWLVPGLAGAAVAAAVVLYTGARHRADEVFLAEHIDLFESYEAVASVGAVDRPEDVQVVAHLDELREGRP